MRVRRCASTCMVIVDQLAAWEQVTGNVAVTRSVINLQVTVTERVITTLQVGTTREVPFKQMGHSAVTAGEHSAYIPRPLSSAVNNRQVLHQQTSLQALKAVPVQVCFALHSCAEEFAQLCLKAAFCARQRLSNSYENPITYGVGTASAKCIASTD